MNKNDAFSVKRSIYIKSQWNRNAKEVSSGVSMRFKALLKTVSGHVHAKTTATFHYSATCSNGEYIPLHVFFELRTLEEDIDVNLEGDDANLRYHELKHKNIYIKYGNDSWDESTTISRRMTNKKVCEKIKEDYWGSVETRVRNMLNLQNAWDDEDVNNISHERINVNQELKKLKKQWQESKCE